MSTRGSAGKAFLEVSCLLLAIGASAQERPGAGATQLIPRSDPEALALIVAAAKADSADALGAAREKIAAFPAERMLSAVSFALRYGEGKELSSALQVVGRDISDRRLVPYVADCIDRSEGRALFEAVRAAKRLPDVSYLPGLMDHAIESDYSEMYTTAPPHGGVEFSYNSVSQETAELLYVLSDGKIGLEQARRNRWRPEGRQIKEWVAWWEERRPAPPAPREDREVIAVLVRAETTEDADAKTAARAELGDLPRERVVGALFFALGQGADTDRLTALKAVGTELFDRRLVPFVADCLAKTEGEVLLESIRAAKRLPDERYMQALIEHCLASDYHQARTVSVDGVEHPSYVSVFGEAAELLFVLSRAQIGVPKAYTDTMYQGGSKANQDKLAGEWRAWWEAQPRP